MGNPIGNPKRTLFLAWLRAHGLTVWSGATTLWLLPRSDGGFEDYMGKVYSETDLPALRTAQGGNVEILELTAAAWRGFQQGKG